MTKKIPLEEPGQNLVIRPQQSLYKLEKVLITFEKENTNLCKKSTLLPMYFL